MVIPYVTRDGKKFKRLKKKIDKMFPPTIIHIAMMKNILNPMKVIHLPFS